MNLKRKYLILILSLIEVCSLFLMYKSFNNKNTVLDDVLVKENEVKKKTFAVMVEGDNGEYTESSSNTWPSGMVYNSELSGCIDIRGNKIDNALSFENNIATLNTNTTAYCYLYFDIDYSKNVYNKVVNDYTNNNGVSLLSETSSDTYPVYYYTGNVTNNNIIYADKCWKMVRTTDTGGVKLIYNGEVTDGSCNNTGTATRIETSGTEFNSNNSVSLAYIGYMYNVSYLKIEVGVNYNIEYIFGNSVSWDGEKYNLVNTISGTWISLILEGNKGLNNYHYTCWNEDCKSVYYIYYAPESIESTYYITLTGGKTVEDALNEMLWAEDVNKYDSTIKTKIDSWYESNIKDLTDSNGKLYSSYLENTIYCNNRATTSLGGWNPNGGITTGIIEFNYNSLECENKTDQFTLKESAGGTLGYGNNALDYPIGLLTYKEAELAINGSNTNYLNNSSYWLMSPYYIGHTGTFIWGFGNGNFDYYTKTSSLGVRPAISLSKKVLIKNGIGDGTVDSPYEVSLT